MITQKLLTDDDSLNNESSIYMMTNEDDLNNLDESGYRRNLNHTIDENESAI